MLNETSCMLPNSVIQDSIPSTFPAKNGQLHHRPPKAMQQNENATSPNFNHSTKQTKAQISPKQASFLPLNRIDIPIIRTVSRNDIDVIVFWSRTRLFYRKDFDFGVWGDGGLRFDVHEG